MSYDWSELEDIFQACLDLPEEERISFILKRAKGKIELQNTLFEMLENVDKASTYFDDLKYEVAKGLHNTEKSHLLADDEIVGKYQIIKQIGAGGMGEVYLARRNDQEFDQIVAIKCFAPAKSHQHLQFTFDREKRFLAKLDHPSIATIIDAGIHENKYPFLIMQYAKGVTLDEYLKEHKLSKEEQINLFLKLCEAIQFAHQQLILHLDIKPSNILVENHNKIKLLDFGISSQLDEVIDLKQLRASPYYAAPEQYQSKEAFLSTDVYQLGIILHLILTQELPFHQNELHHAYKKTNINAQVPKELSLIIEKCLDHQPKNRYQSVQEIIDRIGLYKSGYAIPELATSWQYRAKKFIQRNSLVSSLTVLLVLSLFSGMLLSYYNMKEANANRKKAEKTTAFLLSIFDKSNAQYVEDADLSLKDVLKKSEASVSDFFDQQKDRRDIYASLISIYSNSNLWQEAAKLGEENSNLFDLKDEISFKANRELALSYRYLSKFPKADSIYQKLNSKAKQLNITDIEFALALKDWAKLKETIAEYDSALILLENAESLITKNHPLIQADIFQYKSDVYLKRDELQLAESYQVEAIDLINQYGSESEQLGAYSGLGIIYKNQKEYDKAIKAFKKSMGFYQNNELSDSITIAVAYGNLGGTYYKKLRYDSATWFLENALRIMEKKLDDQNHYVISALFNLANVYLDQDSIDKALDSYLYILEIDKKAYGEDHPIIADDFVAIAICHRLNEDFYKAIAALNTAKTIYEASLPKGHQRFSRLYSKYADVYRDLGNTELESVYTSLAEKENNKNQ